MPDHLDNQIEGERTERLAKLMKDCMHRYPHQRIGQILSNALKSYAEDQTGIEELPIEEYMKPDVFYMPDDFLFKALQHYSTAPVE